MRRVLTGWVGAARASVALPAGDLLLDPTYRRLWVSILISSFGGQVTLLALPLTAAEPVRRGTIPPRWRARKAGFQSRFTAIARVRGDSINVGRAVPDRWRGGAPALRRGQRGRRHVLAALARDRRRG